MTTPSLPYAKPGAVPPPPADIIPDGARYLDECFQEQPFPEGDDGAYSPQNYVDGIYYPDFYSSPDDDFTGLTDDEIKERLIAEGRYSPQLFVDGIYYPEAHTDNPLDMMQYGPTAYLQAAIASWIDDPMTLVAADTFLFYDAGDRRARVGPDVFVIPGIPQEPPQRSYYLWEEGHYPTLIIEILSRRTHGRDLTFKRALYESWGVTEYIVHDPNQDLPTPLLLPPVVLLRMGADGQYYGVPSRYDAERDIYIVHSAVLGLELHGRRDWLRLYNPATGEYLPDYQELKQAGQDAEAQRHIADAQRHIAEAQRDAEQQARRNAEAERDAATAEIARRSAEAERDAATAEIARRSAEAERDAAAAENARLRAEIARLSPPGS